MSTRAARIEDAFDVVCDVYDELDGSDKYYFEAWVEEYFRLKGLYLQATSGNVDRSNRPWRGCNPKYMKYYAHSECYGMSAAEAMEEYLAMILTPLFRNDVNFGEMCYDALIGDPVLKDLGLDDED